VRCDAIPLKPELVFVDNCSTVGTPIYTENIINRTLTSYSIIREWNVADTCGNPSKFTQIINVTIANTGITVASTSCNASSDTIDLNSLLPSGTASNGTWVDTNNTGKLVGSIYTPLDLTIGNYNFEYKISGGDCPLSINVNMNVNNDCFVLDCDNIIIHNAFTPNGDGTNETFSIENIEQDCHLPNTVEIYNRWGILVFETKNYNNNGNSFDGNSNGRATVSQSSGLPTGTYYYIINYSAVDGTGKTQIIKNDGYLYLSK
jgi:gliding motility-associated-like protein